MLTILKLFYLFKLSWKFVAPHSKDININLWLKENQWYRIEYYGFTSRRIAAVWQRKLMVWLDAGVKIHEKILQAWHSHEDDSIVLLWFTNTVVDFKYFYICFCNFHWQYSFSFDISWLSISLLPVLSVHPLLFGSTPILSLIKINYLLRDNSEIQQTIT